jgi:GT2 family glycosyltransferase
VGELRSAFSDIVFVDDASGDDSVSVARKLLPEARIVALGENRGPGAARNAGLASLRSDRILFLDNDVELDPDALEELTRALDAHARAVMAMPRIVSADAPGRIEYEGGEAHFSGLLALRSAGDEGGAPAQAPRRVGSLISCCFLFDRARWRDGPPFDEAIPMYLDDHELGVRARMLGFELLAVPQALGRHGRGTPGISIRATGGYTSRRIIGTIHNRWYVLLKLYQTRTLVLLTPYLVLFEVVQLAGAVALGWGRPWLAALRRFVSAIPHTLEVRARYRGLRRLPDGAVLTGGPHPFNLALRSRRAVRLGLSLLDSVGAANWALARKLVGAQAPK